jgi:hypothetical protein
MKMTDPCSSGTYYGGVDSGAEAPLIWQMMSYPISCQWQVRAGTAGFGHISIFCSTWEWASNLTDTLLDDRFDDYPIGEVDSDTKAELGSLLIEHAPEILSRHYFRTMILAAEILEDLTILRNTMIDDSREKKIARSDLSNGPIHVDKLIEFVNRICKHKNSFHACNHHLPKRFLDSVENFNLQHYTDWKFLTEDCIEIPRYEDVIQTVIGGFKKIDVLLSDLENMARVGNAFGRKKPSDNSNIS